MKETRTLEVYDHAIKVILRVVSDTGSATSRDVKILDVLRSRMQYSSSEIRDETGME